MMIFLLYFSPLLILKKSVAERGKTEGVLGNPAGVYMVYMGVRSAVAELEVVRQGKIKVSDERLARQLEAELVNIRVLDVYCADYGLYRYGINPIPFGEEAKRDPEGACGTLFTNVLWDLAIS
jgi:hypothetical protein